MKFIDFRSDTVTEPTLEMLDAMRNAKVGDDVYNDDPTVKKLQKIAAEKLGKEDALFVPSGTFGNQLAILTHTRRGDEVIISGDNHIVLYEAGAHAVISSVGLRLIAANDGIINVGQLEKAFRSEDVHFPRTGLICMENAHSDGKAVPLLNMQEVYDFSRTIKIPVHLDGARVFNASTFLEVDVTDITRYCDSVMICLSKGLCSPIGSILAGNREFIFKARKNRKLMGGGMRQTGYIAATGIVSIEKMAGRLIDDHKNALYLANRLEESGFFKVNRNRLDINMVFCRALTDRSDRMKLIRYLLKKDIKINPDHGDEFRFVTHYWINKKDIDYFIDTLKTFFYNN